MTSYTIPNVVAQHPRGDRIMDVYSQLLTERVVYLGTGIDAGVANALIAQLRVDVHDAVSPRMLRHDVRDRVRGHAATSLVGVASAPTPRPAGRRRRGTTCAKSSTIPSMKP